HARRDIQPPSGAEAQVALTAQSWQCAVLRNDRTGSGGGPMSGPIVCVIGATGNQGSATSRALAKAGFEVRALVHRDDPDDPRVQRLKSLDAAVVAVDLDDYAGLVEALSGAYGVFCAISFQDGGVKKEEERGNRVANAAKETGIKHYVYSS